MKKLSGFVFFVAAALGLGCGSPDASESLVPAPVPSGSAGAAGAPAEVRNPVGRLRCRTPAGVSGSPGTIEQAVALLNALPKPTSVACFVESLDRPLTVFSTSSPFSAQPALSSKSPRMFLKIGQLWISIVIDGASSELIEFGYIIPETLRSIKAELHLPVYDAVLPGAPYDRVLFENGGTTCGLCHFDERVENVPGIANVFSSIAFRPRPESEVKTESLRLAAQACDWQTQPNRCEMLSAVFDGGAVLDGAFPTEMLTFF